MPENDEVSPCSKCSNRSAWHDWNSSPPSRHRERIHWLLLLVASGRIILEQLGRSLLEVPIILVGILLDIEGLLNVTAPDELLLRRIVEVDYQLADFDRRGIHPHRSVPARAHAEAVELFLLLDRYLVGDFQVAAAFTALQSFQRELLVHGTFNVLVRKLVGGAACLQVDPLVCPVGAEIRRTIVIEVDVLSERG